MINGVFKDIGFQLSIDAEIRILIVVDVDTTSTSHIYSRQLKTNQHPISFVRYSTFIWDMQIVLI